MIDQSLGGTQYTHPIETSQVLHPVFITVLVVVDDGMLLVHTAGLQGTDSGPQMPHPRVRSPIPCQCLYQHP